MKKRIIFFAFSTLVLSSCEKTWQCECTSYSNPPNGPRTVDDTTVLTLKGKKSEMKGSCEYFAATHTHATGGVDCKMK